MLDVDLRHRTRRLMAGEHRTEDLDRLFLGLRERNFGLNCFREMGDFVAHRDTRTKGLVTEVGRDVITSVDVWSLKLRGIEVSLADVTRAAYANLALATDKQLELGCGCRRPVVRNRLKSAFYKISRCGEMTASELKVLDYLGNRFIWRPAFTSDQLFVEFKEVIVKNKLIEAPEVGSLQTAKSFLTLYALSVMHGTSIKLENGQNAKLYAGFANSERHLEVKIEIIFEELGKPLMVPICLFLTDMHPENHCDSKLIKDKNPVLMDHWKFPLYINDEGRLCCASDVPSTTTKPT